MSGIREEARLEDTVSLSVESLPRKVLSMKVLAPAKDWVVVVTRPRAPVAALGRLKV